MSRKKEKPSKLSKNHQKDRKTWIKKSKLSKNHQK